MRYKSLSIQPYIHSSVTRFRNYSLISQGIRFNLQSIFPGKKITALNYYLANRNQVYLNRYECITHSSTEERETSSKGKVFKKI